MTGSTDWDVGGTSQPVSGPTGYEPRAPSNQLASLSSSLPQGALRDILGQGGAVPPGGGVSPEIGQDMARSDVAEPYQAPGGGAPGADRAPPSEAAPAPEPAPAPAPAPKQPQPANIPPVQGGYAPQGRRGGQGAPGAGGQGGQGGPQNPIQALLQALLGGGGGGQLQQLVRMAMAAGMIPGGRGRGHRGPGMYGGRGRWEIGRASCRERVCLYV